MKPKRKNRFKKKRQAEGAKLRSRIGAGLRVLLGLAVLLGGSAAFILAYDCFTQSDQFTASRIEVLGNQQLSRQRVLEIAGIGGDVNILAVNLAAARKRLLAEPWIAEATVSRKIPSGLVLRIREERPLALMAMAADEGFLINAEGRIFKRQERPNPDGLPRITGLSHSDLPIDGAPHTAAYEAVMDLLALAGKTDGLLSLAGIRTIQVDREIGITVFIGENSRAIKLGFGRYRQKCEALEKLMARLKKEDRLEKFKAIDLFDVDRIVVTLALAGPSDADNKEV